MLLVLAACFALASAPAALATTYYVDPAGGNDSWNGTSPSTAWQNLTKVNTVTFSPGDQILLKAGSVWNGQQLYPKGSGSAGSPITVDMYDTGAKPLINAAGAHQEAVHLYNQEYWEIGNLEVTNYDPAGPDVRQGVLAEDVGTVNHIHLLNLDVHDVNGDMTTGRDRGKCNAGITVDVIGAVTPTTYNDILIEGCYVYDVSRSGIKIWGSWGSWCTNPTVALHTNVVVRNNVVDNYAGDGICPHQSDGALTEYNVSSRGCYELEGNLANAAIWSWDQKDAVFQYNEVYDTVQTRDGMAFDIDGCCERNIFQYNYSHDNAGGLLMIIGVPDCATDGSPYVRLPFCDDNDFRYNISQGDRTRILRFVGKIWDNYVYNNTIYVGPPDPLIVDSGGCGGPEDFPDGTYLYNNIIYNTESPNADYTIAGTNYVWDYNVFYGYHPSGEPADPHKLTSDPQFVHPGGGHVGRDTAKAYKLKSTSPCIDSGMTITGSGGQDYFGNPVPDASGYTDRGSHEYSEGGAPVAAFDASPRVADLPATVSFTDLSSESPTSWSWDFGDSYGDTAQNPTHEYTDYGDYTVSLTATNASGQDTTTKTDFVRIADMYCYVSDIALHPEYKGTGKPSERGYWVNGVVTVYDQFGSALEGATVDITWSGCVSGTDSGVTDSQGQVSFDSAKNQEGGWFTLCVDNITKVDYPYDSGSNVETCDSVLNPDTGVQPPVADFSGNPTSGDAPLDVAFTDLSSYNPTSWDWTFGDGGTSTAQHPSHTYAAGTYTVSLTATNSAGSDSETKPDYITANEPQPEPPVADFSGSPLSGNEPLNVDFTDLSTNSPTAWDWTFGDGGTDTAQHPSHTYAEGTYTVSLTAANQYGQDTETKTDYITATSGGDYTCTSMTLEVGTLANGDHTDTHASDDNYMVVQTGRDAGKATTIIVYSFETGLSSISALTITSESHPTLAGQRQRIYAYDFTTSRWSGAAP